MPSGAAQLPGHRGGRCRHRGAVIGCRAPQTLQPERGLRRPAGGRRRRGRQDVRTPATPSVALFASAVRHADRRPSNGSSGRPVCPRVRCPRVRCDAVSGQTRASGVRGRCSRAVRTALDPGTRRCRGTGQVGRTEFDVSPWSASGVVVAARIGPGGEREVVRRAARGWYEWRRQPGPPRRTRTGWGAALAAWATKGAGPASGAGRVGAREGAGAHTSPRRCVLGRLPA